MGSGLYNELFHVTHEIYILDLINTCSKRRIYCTPPFLYMISTIYVLPTALVPLLTIHKFISLVFLYHTHQDLGQTVRDIMFSLNKPNSPYSSHQYLMDRMITYTQARDCNYSPKFGDHTCLSYNEITLPSGINLPKL